MKKIFYTLNLLQSISLVVVIYVNYLANSLPINGMTTGELSALYPNYFVPAGVTFSIWGIIYLLLVLYIIKSWFVTPGESGQVKSNRYIWFILSGAGNAGWILAWHYKFIWLSMGLMLLLLYSLIRLYLITRSDHWPLRVPVSVYFGWITVATIANATALLVSLDWKGGFIGEPVWAILLMIIAVVLSSVIRLRFRDPYFQLVVVWAIFGIWLKFSSSALPSASLMQVAALVLTGVMAVSLLFPYFSGKAGDRKGKTVL
jgi:translocator protein